MLDDVSRAILRHLLDDPTLTAPDLAGLTGVTAGKVARRLDRLSEDFNSSLCREEILHLVNADYKLILSLENTDIYKLN